MTSSKLLTSLRLRHSHVRPFASRSRLGRKNKGQAFRCSTAIATSANNRGSISNSPSTTREADRPAASGPSNGSTSPARRNRCNATWSAVCSMALRRAEGPEGPGTPSQTTQYWDRRVGSAQSAQAPPANRLRRRKMEDGKAALRASNASEFPRRSLSPPRTKSKRPQPASPQEPDSAEARRAEPTRRSPPPR